VRRTGPPRLLSSLDSKRSGNPNVDDLSSWAYRRSRREEVPRQWKATATFLSTASPADGRNSVQKNAVTLNRNLKTHPPGIQREARRETETSAPPWAYLGDSPLEAVQPIVPSLEEEGVVSCEELVVHRVIREGGEEVRRSQISRQQRPLMEVACRMCPVAY